MGYRFGDATPFPLNINFIDTLTAATDACVALFSADEAISLRRDQAHATIKDVDEELKRLSFIERAVEAALAPVVKETTARSTAGQTAARVIASAQSTVKQSRSQLQKRRDVASLPPTTEDTRQQVLNAIETFLLNHELPRTRWDVSWHGTQDSSTATAAMESVAKLHADFAVRIPAASRVARAIRVSDLATGLCLTETKPGRIFKSSTREVKSTLDGFHITEVTLSKDLDSFVAKRHLGKPSDGFEFVMRQADSSEPNIYPLGEDSRRQGTALRLSGEQAALLDTLWENLADAVRSLADHRHSLNRATFGNEDVAGEYPAKLAEALLSSFAPLIREMRARSGVSGELVLKRDLSDGRREELFVPRREIEMKYAGLSYEHRCFFEAVGLGGEATTEFVGRAQQVAPAPAQAPAIAPIARNAVPLVAAPGERTAFMPPSVSSRMPGAPANAPKAAPPPPPRLPDRPAQPTVRLQPKQTDDDAKTAAA